METRTMKKEKLDERYAMKRIVEIVGDLRPLLDDRMRAITPSGFVLSECLKEIEDIAKAYGGIIEPKGEEDNGASTELSTPTGITERPHTDTGTPALQTADGVSASRKSNARERHAQAIATGELKV